MGLPESRKNPRSSPAFVVADFERHGRFAGVEVGEQPREQGVFGMRGFVPGAGGFGVALLTFLRAGEIGENQFRVDHLDVAHRVHRAADVMDVVVLETAHDLHDGVDLADVAQELVAQPLAAARPAHEARDIDELHGRRDDLLGTRQARERLEAGVGHGDDADVGVNSAERIIRRLRLAGAGDGVEEGGLAHVGQSDDTGA